MSVLQSISAWVLLGLGIIAFSQILKFFNISTSEYAVYFVFYIFLVISYFILPDKSTGLDQG